MPLPELSWIHLAFDLMGIILTEPKGTKVKNKNTSTPKVGGAAAGRLEKRTKMYSRCYVNERLRKTMKNDKDIL